MEVEELSETNRGEGGFGSTGVSSKLGNDSKKRPFEEVSNLNKENAVVDA